MTSTGYAAYDQIFIKGQLTRVFLPLQSIRTTRLVFTRYDLRREAVATCVNNAIGAVFVFAAVLKSIDLVGGGDTSSLSSPAKVESFLILFEFGLGFWLIFGKQSVFQYRVVTAVLAFFAMVSLWKWLGGEKTCSCFGALAINPLFTVAFDLSALLTVQLYQLGSASLRMRIVRIISLAVLLLATAMLAREGVRGHLDRNGIPSADLANTAQFPVIKSLLPNLVVFGVNSSPLTGDLSIMSADSVPDFLQAVSRHSSCFADFSKRDSSRLKTIVSGAQDCPVIVEAGALGTLLVLGHCDYEGVGYFQILAGAEPPTLLREDLIYDSVTSVWQLGRQCNQELGLLDCDRLYHNFGLVDRLNDCETVFKLTNGSQSAITINRLRVACSCVRSWLEPDLRQLSPGASVKLHVSVEKGNGSFRQPVSVDAVNGDISTSLTIQVMGSQTATISVVPKQLEFGIVRQKEVRQIRLSERPSDRFTRVWCEEDGSPLVLREVTKKANQSQNLNDFLLEIVLDTKSIPIGTHEGILRINTDSKTTPIVYVPYAFSVAPVFTLSSHVVAFGRLRLGETCSREFRITCDEKFAEWNLVAKENPDLQISISVSEGDFSSEKRLKVSFLASKIGRMDGKVELVASGGGVSQVLPIRYKAEVVSN